MPFSIRPIQLLQCAGSHYFSTLGKMLLSGVAKLPPEQTVYATLAIGEIRENVKT